MLCSAMHEGTVEVSVLNVRYHYHNYNKHDSCATACLGVTIICCHTGVQCAETDL